MSPKPGFDQYLTFINCQLQPADPRWVAPDQPVRRAVTISRQAGCGAVAVAERLAEYLTAQPPNEPPPWTVFDRNLVEKALEDHNLPKRLARFMPEDRISEIADTMDELFGLHPPTWMLARQTSETILHLAELGNVILIGRGANIVTSKMAHVFHVRLVASLERRVAHLQETDRLSPKAALEFVQRADRGRRRYLKRYFDRDIADPLLYHLTINTDLIEYSQAARLIGDAVLSRGVKRRPDKTERPLAASG